MKLLVINNLASGLGDGAIFDYIRAFVEDGDEVTIRTSNGETDLRTFLYDAEEYDLVVASGGDGTISAIAYLLADTGIPLLPFPAGTANLLTTNLQSPTEPHALVKMTRDGKTLDFDLGEVEIPGKKPFGFVLMAGAGYDAKIMKDAADGKKLIGQMAYFTSAVSNAAPQFSEFDLILDGRHVKSSGVGILLINFSKIQMDIRVIHENNPRDGLFDIVIFNTKDAIGLIPAFFAAFLDRSGDFPDRTDALEIYRAKEVEVFANPPLNIQFDGEAVDAQTPFKARVLPGACRLVVSDACLRMFS